MASIINSIIDYATGSGTSESASSGLELLGEIEELEPEAYKKIEPLFPHLQKKGDPVARPTLRRLNFEVNLPRYIPESHYFLFRNHNI